MTNKTLRDYINLIENAQQGVAEGSKDLDPTTKLAIKVIQQNKRRNEPLAYIQAVKHLKRQGWTAQEIKNIESNSSPDAVHLAFEHQGVAEGAKK